MLSYIRKKADDLTFAIFNFIDFCLSREGLPVVVWVAWSTGSFITAVILYIILKYF